MTEERKRYHRAIVYMRRAFRVHDNPALWWAHHDAEEVIPLLCLNPDRRYDAENRRRQFIAAAMHDLDANLRRLGSQLTIRSGKPAEELAVAAGELEADAVYASDVYDPLTLKSDRAIEKSLRSLKIQWVTLQERTLVEPTAVVSGKGEPYRVFTPYYRAWLECQDRIRPELPAIERLNTPNAGRVSSGYIASQHEEGGESLAAARWTHFLERGLGDYGKQRDYPAIDGTSILSPHLALGSISIRKVYWDLKRLTENATPGRKKNIDAFLREIGWREFYYQIMANFPHAATGSFKESADALPWSDHRTRFEAWRHGMTGFPIVDAGMRQLASEGWIHNRVRMIVASFLTKDLHINWQWGEKYFMEHLIDADIASNNGGWQWVAGTGTDASPWFRIFNPITQGKKFDPNGDYVRRYVRELQSFSGIRIHEPWKLPETEQIRSGCLIGRDYPERIVDHSEERTRALEMYRNTFSMREQ